MFQQILVPLDGSQLAEAALPVAVGLAQQLQAKVTLFHVIERHAPTTIHGESHLTTTDAARTYLQAMKTRMAAPSITGEQQIHNHPALHVAQSIVDHAKDYQIDLIVMCSHGSNSLQKRLFGSIAQDVIASGETPVLLVNPEGGVTTFHCTRLLVALDGDVAHEAGLVAAAVLAQQCQAALHLVIVIPTSKTLSPTQSATGRLLPQTTAALLDALEESALAYLESKRLALTPLGVASTCEVQRGDPVAAILATAAVVNADLIVLATHGKTHLDAFWSGSVTAKLVADARRPLLLVPISGRG